MGREYGFRIFRVQAFHNQVKGKEPLSVAVGNDGYHEVRDLLEAASHYGSQFIKRKQPTDPSEPMLSDRCITVSQPVPITDGFLHLAVSLGAVGEHERAVSPNGTTTSLSGKAAEKAHYVSVIFPRGAGDEFLLVCETHHSSDVRRPFLWFLQRLSADAKKETLAQQENDARAALDAGEVAPKKAPVTRLLFESKQISDSDYLNQLLQSAKTASANFTEKVPSTTASVGQVTQKRLTYTLLTDEHRQAAADTGMKWQRRRLRKQKQEQSDQLSEHPDAVVELGEALGLDGAEVQEYDECSVRITSKGGETTTIRPDDLRDMFTYPVSDGQPSVVYYYTKVSPKVAELARDIDLEVEEVAPEEVAECVTGSSSTASVSSPSSEG